MLPPVIGKTSNVCYPVLHGIPNGANVHAAYNVAFGGTAMVTDSFLLVVVVAVTCQCLLTDTQIPRDGLLGHEDKELVYQ